MNNTFTGGHPLAQITLLSIGPHDISTVRGSWDTLDLPAIQVSRLPHYAIPNHTGPIVAEHREAMLQRARRDPHIVGRHGTAAGLSS
jgi:hypothetical protein